MTATKFLAFKTPYKLAVLVLGVLWSIYFLAEHLNIPKQTPIEATKLAVFQDKKIQAPGLIAESWIAPDVDAVGDVTTNSGVVLGGITNPNYEQGVEAIAEWPSRDEDLMSSVLEHGSEPQPKPAAAHKKQKKPSQAGKGYGGRQKKKGRPGHKMLEMQVPLILYAYSESESGRMNLNFFIEHGLHAAADFVFIFNGETDAHELVPDRPNIRIVQRENKCYDIGAYGEILQKDDLYKPYKKFIMLNASIRGPFVPHWSGRCWSDLYLNKITDEVKLVGMTGNCWPQFHVQSMIWATDKIGIELLLFPKQPEPTVENPAPEKVLGHIAQCFTKFIDAIHAEIGATAVIQAGGYKVDVMMSAYHSNPRYIEDCDSSRNGDVLMPGAYFGTNVHPYETIFFKANRGIDPEGLARHTEWVNGAKYSSYDYCSIDSAEQVWEVPQGMKDQKISPEEREKFAEKEKIKAEEKERLKNKAELDPSSKNVAEKTQADQDAKDALRDAEELEQAKIAQASKMENMKEEIADKVIVEEGEIVGDEGKNGADETSLDVELPVVEWKLKEEDKSSEAEELKEEHKPVG